MARAFLCTDLALPPTSFRSLDMNMAGCPSSGVSWTHLYTVNNSILQAQHNCAGGRQPRLILNVQTHLLLFTLSAKAVQVTGNHNNSLHGHTHFSCQHICIDDRLKLFLFVTNLWSQYSYGVLLAASPPTQPLAVMLELTSPCVPQGDQERGAYVDQHEHDISPAL